MLANLIVKTLLFLLKEGNDPTEKKALIEELEEALERLSDLP